MLPRFSVVLITIQVIVLVAEAIFTGFWDCGRRSTSVQRYASATVIVLVSTMLLKKEGI